MKAKAKLVEPEKEPEAEELEGVTHEAYEALRKAKKAHPWENHDNLELQAHIERQKNYQIKEAARRKREKEKENLREELTAKQLDAAKAKVAHLEAQLHEQETEQSSLLQKRRATNSVEYIYNIDGALGILKEVIARTSRELKQAQKLVSRAQERADEQTTIKERWKQQYIVLKTVAEREIQARVQAQRKRKIEQAMRSTEGPIQALADQQQNLAEKIAVEFGPDELRRLNEHIQQLNTR